MYIFLSTLDLNTKHSITIYLFILSTLYCEQNNSYIYSSLLNFFVLIIYVFTYYSHSQKTFHLPTFLLTRLVNFKIDLVYLEVTVFTNLVQLVLNEDKT